MELIWIRWLQGCAFLPSCVNRAGAFFVLFRFEEVLVSIPDKDWLGRSADVWNDSTSGCHTNMCWRDNSAIELLEVLGFLCMVARWSRVGLTRSIRVVATLELPLCLLESVSNWMTSIHNLLIIRFIGGLTSIDMVLGTVNAIPPVEVRNTPQSPGGT